MKAKSKPIQATFAELLNSFSGVLPPEQRSSLGDLWRNEPAIAVEVLCETLIESDIHMTTERVLELRQFGRSMVSDEYWVRLLKPEAESP